MRSNDSRSIERQGLGIVATAFERIDFAFREQTVNDFGIDAHAELINKGSATGQLLGMQAKAGPSYFRETTDRGYVFRVDKNHVDYWLAHTLPVLICLCDVERSVVHWQHICIENVIETGARYKIVVPYDQRIATQSMNALRDLVTPVIPSSRYTVFRTDDSSHGIAKRYSFNIVVNGLSKKSEIAAVVRQATSEGVRRRYHRNHLVERRWGDADADVVWTFVYLSAEDEANNNWICRSMWVREDLPEDARPSMLTGENIGGLITVDWRDDYDVVARLMREHTLTKEDYLGNVIPMVDELEPLLGRFENALNQLRDRALTMDSFLDRTEKDRRRINELYMLGTEGGLAPFECAEVSSKFQELIASMDNMVLPFTERGRRTWSESKAVPMCMDYADTARERMGHFRYEVQKIR